MHRSRSRLALRALPLAVLGAVASFAPPLAAAEDTSPTTADAASVLDAAGRRLAAGDHAGAVELLAPLVAAPAPPDEARVLLASAYLDLGRAAEAARVLAPLTAADAAAPHGEALFFAARAALALGRAAEAEALLARSAAVAPVSFAAVLLADVRSQQGRHEEAAALLAPVVASLGEVAGRDRALEAQIALHYGRTLTVLGRREEAIEHLRRASKLAPASADAWRLLGEALVDLGAIDDAREALTRAQELEQAQQSADAAAAERRRRVDELVLAAAAHRQAGRSDAALTALRQAIELAPEALQPRLLEVRLLAALDRIPEATARADELVGLAADQPDARHVRGLVRLTAGDAAGAESDFRHALGVAPDHRGAGNGLAMALLALGRRDEAQATVERVLARWPDDELALRTRQRLRAAAGSGR
ncbi:MAG TPA: tetratricopeptide repeat protein [Thermoanaerobaculia bacterium]